MTEIFHLLFVFVLGCAGVFLFQKALARKIHAYQKRTARRIYRRINADTLGSAASVMAYLRKVNPYVFEELVLLAFEKKGCSVIRNRRYSGDGGVDGHVIIDGVRIPVQSKRYRGHIKKSHVEAFENLLVCRNKPYGYFIHTGRTGKGCRGAEFPHVRFISGDRLLALLKSPNS